MRDLIVCLSMTSILMQGCLTSSRVDGIDLAHSSLWLHEENIFLDHADTTYELKLFARTSSGQWINNSRLNPIADNCQFVPTQTDNPQDGLQGFAVTCTAIGIKTIGVQLEGDRQSIVVPDLKSAIHVMPNQPSKEIVAGWPLILQASPRLPDGTWDWHYQGQIYFESTDPLASMPEMYTFVDKDNGIRMFTQGISLRTSGAQHVRVVDTHHIPIQPDKNFMLQPSMPKHIIVTNLATQYLATDPIALQLATTDEFGSWVDFTGEVTVSGPRFPEPMVSPVRIEKNKPFVFPAFYIPQVGLQKIEINVRADDPTLTIVHPISVYLSILPGPAAVARLKTDKVLLTAGQSISGQLEIRDAVGNRVPTFVGPVLLQTTDTQLNLEQIMFGVEDFGVRYMSWSFLTAGIQDIILQEGDGLQLQGDVSFTIEPGRGRKCIIQGPDTIRAGDPFVLHLSFLDIYDNVTQSASGMYTWIATSAEDYATSSFDVDGLGNVTAQAQLMHAAQYQVIVRNDTDPAFVSQIKSIQVQPGACAKTDWVDSVQRIGWQEPVNPTVVVMDAYGNLCQSDGTFALISDVSEDAVTLGDTYSLSAQSTLTPTFAFQTTGIRHLHVRDHLTSRLLDGAFLYEVLKVERLMGDNGNGEVNCVQLSNKEVKCWGDNRTGRLGIGDSMPRGRQASSMGAFLPSMKLPSGSVVQQLSSGEHQTCVVLSDNRLICYGEKMQPIVAGPYGLYLSQVGNQAQSIPVMGSLNNTATVAVGYWQTCTITLDGSVSCWGSYPQTLGMNYKNWWEVILPTENLLIPLGTNRQATSLSQSGDHTTHAQHCAILDTEEIKCWGVGWFGGLGNGGTWDILYEWNLGDNLAPVDLGVNQSAKQVATGQYNTTILLNNGTVKALGWGWRLPYADGMNRGDSSWTLGDNLPPVDFGMAESVSSVSSGRVHACALFVNGQVKCWGENETGNLGMGDTIPRGRDFATRLSQTPVLNLGSGRYAQALQTFNSGGCVLLDNARVKCWGFNYFGQVGIEQENDIIGDDAFEMGDDLPYLKFW